MTVRFVVAWCTDSHRGYWRDYRTFETLERAEKYLEVLNNRDDCHEGYVARIEDEVTC